MSPKIMKKPAGLGKDDIKIQVHIWQGVKKYECESVLFEKKQTFTIPFSIFSVSHGRGMK